MDPIALPEPDELPSDALLRAKGPVAAADRRRHRRISVDLPAKVVLPSGEEVEARIATISAGGAELVVPVAPPLGARVVAYAERLGRLEGEILRPTRDGLVLTFSKRASRAKRLADALTWVRNMGPDRDRRGARRYAKQEPATLTRANGAAVSCRILDISTTGASVGIDAHARPAIGERVTLGVMEARVVRHHEAGIGVAFAEAGKAGAAVPPANHAKV